jgi:hypothetical protein
MSVIPPAVFQPDPLPPAGTPKKALHDGVAPVKEISILGMFRNNGPFLKNFFFKQMECLEATYDVVLKYYFIENDSTDDTRDLLKDWFAGKGEGCGRLILGKLARPYVNKGENYDRTFTLSRLRNSLLEAVSPLTSQWTVFLDSHIYFRSSIFDKMINQVKPAANNIAMVTPYTHQVYTFGQLSRMGVNIQFSHAVSDDTQITLQHQFDTYTFYNMDSHSYFPLCPFKKCQICPHLRKDRGNDQPLYEASEAIVDCRSSFNGFGLITTAGLNHPRVRWGTLTFDHSGNQSLCDHPMMIDRLCTVTGGRCVLVQAIDDLYRTY